MVDGGELFKVGAEGRKAFLEGKGADPFIRVDHPVHSRIP